MNYQNPSTRSRVHPEHTHIYIQRILFNSIDGENQIEQLIGFKENLKREIIVFFFKLSLCCISSRIFKKKKK